MRKFKVRKYQGKRRPRKETERQWYRVGDLVMPLLEHICPDRIRGVQLVGVVTKVEGPMRAPAYDANVRDVCDRARRVYRYEIVCVCPRGCRATAIAQREFAPELLPVHEGMKDSFSNYYYKVYREAGFTDRDLKRMFSR